jgi:hypothetical protein
MGAFRYGGRKAELGPEPHVHAHGEPLCKRHGGNVTLITQAVAYLDVDFGSSLPRYKHGGMGACVNNAPCRGFGAMNDKGQILWDIGGCGEGQRCDEKRLTCVADDEPPFNRTQ